MSCANWRVAMLAVASFAVLPFMPLQARQVKPGTGATGAMGARVEPVNRQAECPDQDAPANAQEQTK